MTASGGDRPKSGASSRVHVAAAVMVCAASLPAAGAEVSDYRIEDLLSPCIEADNDTCWGAAAEGLMITLKAAFACK